MHMNLNLDHKYVITQNPIFVLSMNTFFTQVSCIANFLTPPAGIWLHAHVAVALFGALLIVAAEGKGNVLPTEWHWVRSNQTLEHLDRKCKQSIFQHHSFIASVVNLVTFTLKHNTFKTIFTARFGGTDITQQLAIGKIWPYQGFKRMFRSNKHIWRCLENDHFYIKSNFLGLVISRTFHGMFLLG